MKEEWQKLGDDGGEDKGSEQKKEKQNEEEEAHFTVERVTELPAGRLQQHNTRKHRASGTYTTSVIVFIKLISCPIIRLKNKNKTVLL